ncbi:MAG: glycine--tRNA ligase subunit beta [Alphaproteobacteria bacterium]|nr:glycine--tRNA ligase subunit beta [Alphaproteobacteria bacterium]
MMNDKFLLEIGIEEIPAQYVRKMASSLLENMQKALTENAVAFDGIEVFHTPRRLIVYINSIALQVEGQEVEVKGPAQKSAYDENGKPTKALEGFLAGRKLSIADTFIKDIKGVDYIFATQKTETKDTGKILEEILPNVIMSVYQPNPMRWNVFVGKYIRPIRWLLAFLGAKQLNFALEFLASSDYTMGHRMLADGKFTVTSVDDYFAKAHNAFVIIDQNERRDFILKQIHDLEQKHNIEVPIDESLLDEIVNLVEYPTAAIGTFDENFLSMPDPIIITPMKDHQRYFPVYKNGRLANCFVFVRNGGDYCIDGVTKGNQRVLTARLKDGEFFYAEDKRTTLADKAKKLQDVVFQTKLGNYVQKMERVAQIASALSNKLNLNLEKEIKTVVPVLKADLVSAVVGEFSELQGIMGAIYAKEEGYSDEVSRAIAEQYLPRYAGDKLPETILGAIIAIADKLDTVMGLCAVNLRPTGSQDPFALRRQTIGILAIIGKFGFDFSLTDFINSVSELYKAYYTAENTTREEFADYVINFVKQRFSIMLNEDLHYSITDVINRIDMSALNVIRTENKAQAISELQTDAAFQSFNQTLQRMDNLLGKEKKTAEFNKSLVINKDESAVVECFAQIKDKAESNLQANDYKTFVNTVAECCALINTFFDNNMVLSPDAAERQNRVALLSDISALMHRFVA